MSSSAPPAPSAPQAGPPAFRSLLPSLAMVTTIFLCNFLTRIMLAPLTVPMEVDLGLGHGAVGRLFLAISLGASLSLLLSGFVSQALGHRRTIVVSSLLLGATTLAAAASQSHGHLLMALLAMGCAAGLYFPSGLATITTVAPPRHWGKALALHEAAPNSSFVLAPLLTEALVEMVGWRGVLAVLGCGSLAAGLAYGWRGPWGGLRGEPLRPALVADILRRPAFWGLSLLFCAAVGGSTGPYTMLSLYLVEDQGYAREAANLLLSVSRISGLVIGLGAGLLTDRLGVWRTLVVSLVANGLLLMALGLVSGGWLVAAVLAQPVFSVCFFPAGFTVVARIFPAAVRHVALGLMMPLTAVMGAGAVPALLGWAGERRAFGLSFVLLGGCLLACLACLPALVRAYRQGTTALRQP